MSTPTVADTPCAVCGCHMVALFTCGCGSCKDEPYCDNCGRFRRVAVSDEKPHPILDPRCEHGPVAHVHSPDEKAARVAAFQKQAWAPSREDA